MKGVTFLGRNGTFNMAGIEVWAGPDSIHLEPITSKGKIGRAWLEVPKEDVVKVIQVMADQVGLKIKIEDA